MPDVHPRLALAGVLAALAACAHQPAARTVGYSLLFVDDPAFLKLSYGRPGSNALGLMLECVKGSRTVRVLDVSGGADHPSLTLQSGGQRAALKVSTEVEDGRSLAMARASTDSPPLNSFRRSGRLTVDYGSARYSLAANPEEQGRVERFFKACGGG